MRYVFGYPLASVRPLAVECLQYLPGLALFVVGPAGGIVLIVTSCEGWLWLVGIVLLVGLAAVLLWGLVNLARDLRTVFGLRVVVQFEQPIPADLTTWFGGERVARSIRSLDRLASTAGVHPLSDFGGWRSRGVWFESAVVHTTIVALRLSVSDPAIAAELERLAAALDYATSQNVRCRLVIVTCTAMNAAYFAQLRAKGF